MAILKSTAAGLLRHSSCMRYGMGSDWHAWLVSGGVYFAGCSVARIALVKPEKARGVENLILQMAQRGQITEKVGFCLRKSYVSCSRRSQ